MKPSIFNTIIEEKDYLLMFNSLSGALLKLPKESLKKHEKDLYKEGFFVEDDKDELLTYKYIYYKKLFGNNKNLDITIALTTNCNLCCPYCFEMGNRNKEYINQEVTDAIIKYITSQKNKNIHITWFGGEPLLCFDRIIEINEKLILNEISFRASLITNGTLFSDKIIENLHLLKLNNIQITLDGNRLMHNQKRFFSNGIGTFDIILSNVTSILEKTNIHLTLKINVDKSNIDSCLEVSNEITNKYSKYITQKQLTITNNSIKNKTDYEGCSQCLSEDEYFDFKTKVLHEKISLPRLHLACPLRFSEHIMIGPDGSIYKCLEHIGNKPKSIGNIKSYHFSISQMAKLALNNEPFNDPECSKCSILPICGGGCPIDREIKLSGKEISLCPYLKNNLSTMIKKICNNL